MRYKKLYTVSDGYGCNHIYPMWPELLARVINTEWVNLSTMGSGNELIATQVIDALEKEPNPQDTLWVIQWTNCTRLDLQVDLDNQELIDDIKTDKVYSRNFATTRKNKTFWASSASELAWVQTHNDLLLEEQHQARGRMAQLATTYALEHYSAKYKYLFSYDSSWSKNNLVNPSKYIWEPMSTFRYGSQFNELDVGEVQPVSSVHLEFLDRYLLPELEYDRRRYEQILEETLTADRVRKAVRG